MLVSKRLEAVASMVTPGNVLVDVGTDHGYIPIYLVKNHIIPRAIAMDINKGPLERANENIGDYHLEKYIETRLSDGVASLKKGEGDTLLIAGMGGGLMLGILRDGKDILSKMKEFILQPQSDVKMVRKFLQKEGYLIAEENMILEDGKYYPMMKVQKGEMKYEKEIFFEYGKLLLEEKNSVLKEFLDKEYHTCLKIQNNLEENGKNEELIFQRKKEIDARMKSILEAKEYFRP